MAKPPEQKIKPFSYWKIFFMVLLAGAFFYLFTGKKGSATQKSWNDVYEMIEAGDVKTLSVINKENVNVILKKDRLTKPEYSEVAGKNKDFPGPHYFFQIGSVEVFEQQLAQVQEGVPVKDRVDVVYSTTSNWFSDGIWWLIPLVLFFLFYFFIGRIFTGGGMKNQMFDFGKSKAAVFDKSKKNAITFKDVAGYDEAKTEVIEIVEFLKSPAGFTKLGAKIPKGILLVGPPGTGKTLLARAVAGESGVPFFSLTGSEFIEMFVGVGASRVRDLFEKAKQAAPSIIFIDEIDTVGRVRGKALSIQANDEHESTLNQLLAEMDGFDAGTGVIVMGATNRADILDPALLRPGRFDRHIYLELPNKVEREAIFRVHLKPIKMDQSVNIEYLASQTPGFSGADIANVCNEAALIASRKKKNTVTMEDFYDAVDRVVSGLEHKSKIISPEEKKIIAYHEAGHAIVSWMLPGVDPLVKISIIPRGKTLGSAWYLPEERQIITRSRLLDQMCAALGGRTAEEVIFNEVSSGAVDDLEKVTKQAYTMVAHMGLSEKLGNISYYDSTHSRESAFTKPYSEETSRLIDEEVQSLVKTAHEKTKLILEKHRDKLDKLASALLEKEILPKDALLGILGDRPSGK